MAVRGKQKITHNVFLIRHQSMIDISGYSSLFSKLAELGKVSSEIVTKSVGEYLNQTKNHSNMALATLCWSHLAAWTKMKRTKA
ncbi:hypothetical protein HDU97_008107 [Phlyctochytrium planicorne]|nr:hypothetical protein HDU97_008107 [Phlyctochytrium planicorne]